MFTIDKVIFIEPRSIRAGNTTNNQEMTIWINLTRNNFGGSLDHVAPPCGTNASLTYRKHPSARARTPPCSWRFGSET